MSFSLHPFLSTPSSALPANHHPFHPYFLSPRLRTLTCPCFSFLLIHLCYLFNRFPPQCFSPASCLKIFQLCVSPPLSPCFPFFLSLFFSIVYCPPSFTVYYCTPSRSLLILLHILFLTLLLPLVVSVTHKFIPLFFTLRMSFLLFTSPSLPFLSPSLQ